MNDLEKFAHDRCRSTLVEDMFADAVEHKAIVLPGSAKFVEIIVRENCWRGILSSTNYPHMFALYVLRALPRTGPTASSAWTLLKQWTGVADDFLAGEVYLDHAALCDILFGPYWRVFLEPAENGLIPLYHAVLRNKPAFANGLLPARAHAEVDLPALTQVDFEATP